MSRSIDSLIDTLEQASQLPTKRRTVNIDPTVDALASALYETGALPDEVVRLVNLVTKPSHLTQAIVGTIIRHLYPATKVPREALLQVLGCLGHGELKPSLSSQHLLLRWLVMVNNVLEDPALLSQAYSVLFNLLNTAALRPQLCHLLALITRRKHVRPFRIQALLSLSRHTGNDPALTGLLRVYKSYYPEIIVGDATKGRASSFKHPDPQWRSQLEEIQASHLGERDKAATTRNKFQMNHLLGKQINGQRRIVIPAAHTLQAHESSVTLAEIDGPENLAKNLDKIELPSQLIAVLADPLLQKLMALKPNNEAHMRVNNWVLSCLSDVSSGNAGIDVLLDMVEILQDYVSSTQLLTPTLLHVFAELFQIWDGSERREVILDVLSYLPLSNYDNLYKNTLGPLEACILDNTAERQLILLSFYTALLRRWRVIMLSANDPSALPLPSVAKLVSHVNLLCLTISQTSPTVSSLLSIFEFFNCAQSLLGIPSLSAAALVETPPPSLVYLAHFSHSPAVVSSLYSVVAGFKRGLEAAMTQNLARTPTQRESENIRTFNGFLMDICNCIWRAKAFGTTDANARGCQVSRVVVSSLQQYLAAADPESPLSSAFDVSHSPALCLQSLYYIRGLEDTAVAEKDGYLQERHGGPVTQKSLVALRHRGGLELSWQEYRLGVLRHLEENGFGGISTLMYNTMKNLMQAKSS
ncbi:hypothetical protein VTK73DRAFT_8445 [Phialemonium thermophilum]|uniref:Mis6 domain-containing protein n=1 Tax=Phialemonium thermophilum TaxID=223376 RepID=A0ABR3XNP7_9PEZI